MLAGRSTVIGMNKKLRRFRLGLRDYSTGTRPERVELRPGRTKWDRCGKWERTELGGEFQGLTQRDAGVGGLIGEPDRPDQATAQPSARGEPCSQGSPLARDNVTHLADTAPICSRGNDRTSAA